VFRWSEGELPHLVCQVAGATPEEMVPAARRVQECGFFGFDINMGCSVSGIVKKNAGAGLLRDPDAALRVVEAVRRTISIPLFIKFRTGWSPDIEPAAKLAKQFENAGADCLVFHPRVAPDKRTRPPVRHHIKAIVDAVSIPVFGNGDVITDRDCLEMLETTGCAGNGLRITHRPPTASGTTPCAWPTPWTSTSTRCAPSSGTSCSPSTSRPTSPSGTPCKAASWARNPWTTYETWPETMSIPACRW
jgi:hypothetical protein